MVDFNYFKLGLTVFISVLFAGLILFFIEQYYYSNMLDRFMTSIPKVVSSFQRSTVPFVNFPSVQQQTTSQIRKLQESNRKEQNRLRAESRAQLASRQSIRKTNDETCSYWREQYRKNKAAYNKVNLDSACSRAAND